MNVLLVRHGETSWNREGRYQGRTDIPLSADGVMQVQRLGERLRNIALARVIASPLGRARATAEAIVGSRELVRDARAWSSAIEDDELRDVSTLDHAGVRDASGIEIDPGLLEISHGQWEGQLASEVELSHAEMFGVWRSSPGRDAHAGPGAETLGDVEERAWPVLERLCASLGANDTGMIVAHDAVNRVLLCRVLGLPLERVWKFRQAPAALNILSGPSLAELQVVRLNDSEHSTPFIDNAQHRAL
jgi:broad specificity phosphatase PhoE